MSDRLRRLRYPEPTEGTAVVWGIMGHYPFGGMVWQVLHHLAGLRELGFDVWYVEDSDAWLQDPETLAPTDIWEPTARLLRTWLSWIGLEDRWFFRPPERDHAVGSGDLSDLRRLYRTADLGLNLCGAHELRDGERPRRVAYLETDPVAPQVLVAQDDPYTIEQLSAHDRLFTYGTNLGAPDCRVPVERYEWHATVPPVVVEWWDAPAPPAGAPVSTVMQWRNQGKDVEWNGDVWRWSKHHTFDTIASLPGSTTLPLEVAVRGPSPDAVAALSAHGWRVRMIDDEQQHFDDPMGYRSYIRESCAELSIAKEQYVVPRSGWISDRTVCYLAAGRPAVVEDTGIAAEIPTGKGLLTFCDFEGARECLDELEHDYDAHAAAARELARNTFDAAHVLRSVVERAG